MNRKKGFLDLIKDLFIYDEVYNINLVNDKGIIAYDIHMRSRFLRFFKYEDRKIGSIYFDPKLGKYTIEIDKFDSIKEYKTPEVKNPEVLLPISFDIAFKGTKELIDIVREDIPAHDKRNVVVNIDISDITNSAIDYYIKEMNK